MKTKIKVLLSVSLLAAFLFSCASSGKKGHRMSNSGPHHKIKTEMGNM